MMHVVTVAEVQVIRSFAGHSTTQHESGTVVVVTTFMYMCRHIIYKFAPKQNFTFHSINLLN